MANKFTQDNFESDVLKASELVLVDFYADWCGPCKMMGPVIDDLATAYSDGVKIGKLDVDNSPQIAAKYKVMSIPTVIFFKNGEAVETLVGLQKKELLEEKIKQYK